MMEIILLFKALISRLLFMGHGIYAVYLHYTSTNDMTDWWLVTPVAFILVEAAVTLLYRKGVEYKYVWPSGFLYISCLVPIIWMIELNLLNVRIKDHQASFGPSGPSNKSVDKPLTKTQNQQLRGELLLKAILGSNETRKKVCELGLIIGIIIGRWLIPRGTLTRDQLSVLLLGYVSNSADILELFTTFEEPELFDKRSVTVAIMAVFTLSIYQFSLNSTATMESEDNGKKKEKTLSRGVINRNRVHPRYMSMKRHQNRLSGDVRQSRQSDASLQKDEYIEKVRTRRVTLHAMPERDNRGRGRKISVPDRKVTLPDVVNSANSVNSARRKLTLPPIRRNQRPVNGTPVNAGATEQEENVVKRRWIHGEVFNILVTLLMQDGPFLILRTYLIIKYSVASEMHIFFTCKNAIVSILLVYRLLILSCSGKDEESEIHREEAEAKLQNIQRAIENLKLNDVERGKMYVG